MNTLQAKALGSIAYAKGINAPALDKDFFDAYLGLGLKIGEGIDLLKAWGAGWTEANLAALV